MRLSENLARGAECPSWVQDCLSFVSAFGLVQFGAAAGEDRFSIKDQDHRLRL